MKAHQSPSVQEKSVQKTTVNANGQAIAASPTNNQTNCVQISQAQLINQIQSNGAQQMQFASPWIQGASYPQFYAASANGLSPQYQNQIFFQSVQPTTAAQQTQSQQLQQAQAQAIQAQAIQVMQSQQTQSQVVQAQQNVQTTADKRLVNDATQKQQQSACTPILPQNGAQKFRTVTSGSTPTQANQSQAAIEAANKQQIARAKPQAVRPALPNSKQNESHIQAKQTPTGQQQIQTSANNK